MIVLKEVTKLNNRIKSIRKALGLSQKDFGKKIGISDTAVSKLENGERNPSEQTLKSICREFNVDYFWLTEGKGEMFTAIPETIVDELVSEYNLDEYGKYIIQTFLESSDEQREAVGNFLLTLAEKISKKSSE